MWKGANGSVQSGLFCGNASLARNRAKTKLKQTITVLRRISPPNHIARFVQHRAKYNRPLAADLLASYLRRVVRTFVFSQSVIILRAVGDMVSSMSLYSLGAPVF